MKKPARRTALRITLLIVVALPGVLFGVSSCISFHLSPREVEAFFGDKPHKPRYKTYSHKDRPMHYAEVGAEGKPLVLFVHGSPGSWDNFIGLMGDPDLLEAARLVSVDRSGFGKSGAGRPECSMREQAAAIRPILDTNDSGNAAIVVGHSLGGAVAARLAMDHPESVGGLILVAPSIDPELEKVRWFQIPAELRGELEKMLDLWPDLQVPVTVIQGEKDRLVPPANADFAQRALVNATVKIIRDAELNHFVPWKRPNLIRDAILDHLAARSP